MKRAYTRYCWLITALMLCSGVYASADVPTFSAHFSRDSVEVGDQVEYIIDVDVDRATHMEFPIYGEVLTDAQRERVAQDKAKISTYTAYDEDRLELISMYATDTLKVDGRTLKLRKRYRFAAMDTGDIPIQPAILYFPKNSSKPDTLLANEPVVLHVKRYEELDSLNFMSNNMFVAPGAMGAPGAQVDTAVVNKYIKLGGVLTQQDMPFIAAEIPDKDGGDKLMYILLTLLALAILGIGGYFIYKRVHAKGVEKSVALLPPHVEANKALVELHHRKLWQNGNYKGYYTQLSMILRRYISRRWEIRALEFTTDEIIAAMRDINIADTSRDNLMTILRTADMVKFAKAEPEAEHNEECYTMAYYFVENTKVEEIEVDKDKEDITIDTKIGD